MHDAPTTCLKEARNFDHVTLRAVQLNGCRITGYRGTYPVKRRRPGPSLKPGRYGEVWHLDAATAKNVLSLISASAVHNGP